MGDNDFPMTMANGPMGFLQTYVKGMQDYQQAGTGIPDFRLQNQYAQDRTSFLLMDLMIAPARF